jgi:hypothetical protein
MAIFGSDKLRRRSTLKIITAGVLGSSATFAKKEDHTYRAIRFIRSTDGHLRSREA